MGLSSRNAATGRNSRFSRRASARLTQERMAELMGVEQQNVSGLERRADLLLSTSSSYAAAMEENCGW